LTPFSLSDVLIKFSKGHLKPMEKKDSKGHLKPMKKKVGQKRKSNK
jgi:hypothetical protein